VVLTVPKIDKGRYFVFQVLDLYTFNADYIGSRATGNDGGTFLFVGPSWKGEAPAGITKVLHMETELLSVVGRTQLFNPKDLDNVKKIQAGYKVQTLSAFLGATAPPASPEPNWPMPLDSQQARGSLDFFDRLAFLLQFAQPPHPSEVALLEGFAKIGIVAGKRFDPAKLSAEMQTALKDGMADGQKEIDAKRASLGGKTEMLFGSRDFLKNDYVARATGTQMGIGANSREEAMYPILSVDAEGAPLNGSQRYTLHFAKGSLPPVNAFWSLTMYDLPKQLLAKNPIDRYLINSPMLPQLKTDSDGGLTIYVQHASPGKGKESNWLPAPDGLFMITMRFYWPKPEVLDGTWKEPAVMRVK
jgi:hypothetical protein